MQGKEGVRSEKDRVAKNTAGPPERGGSTEKYLATAVGAVAGGLAAVVAAPVVVTSLGFTAAGITAGSAAASMMSAAATYGVGGGVVATLQSIGATGAVGLMGAGAGAAIGSAAGSRACDETKENCKK